MLISAKRDLQIIGGICSFQPIKARLCTQGPVQGDNAMMVMYSGPTLIYYDHHFHHAHELQSADTNGRRIKGMGRKKEKRIDKRKRGGLNKEGAIHI